MEIIRSIKVSPGLTVTRTTTQSDKTRVPPVTEEKSPPDSRMTGADSPVMADSSTEATPAITSPSAAITSLASAIKISPLRNCVADTSSEGGSASKLLGISVALSFLAQVSFFKPLNDAACALLRPSAKASAKFANKTVNQSQSMTHKIKLEEASPSPYKDCTQSNVVKMLPI